MTYVAGHATRSNECLLTGIIEWIEIEGRTIDSVSVDLIGDHVEEEFDSIGLEGERTPGEDGWRDLIGGRASGRVGSNRKTLVISHLDTARHTGTEDKGNPMHMAGNKLYGPGSYDIRVGAYIAYYAYKNLWEEGRENILPITFMSLPEEERRDPYSGKYISEEAHQAKYVLATKARDGGAEGRPTHAGLKHEYDRSATREILKIVCKIKSWADVERGITFYGAQQPDEYIYISSLEPRIRACMKILGRLN